MYMYEATVHGYQTVLPPRCKLERLEPVTRQITMPLHYAEEAPVAMRAAGPLTYTNKAGDRVVYRKETIELYALDGRLWRERETTRWHDGAWTPEDLAKLCANKYTNCHPLDRWSGQYRDDAEPARGMLAREHGSWLLVDAMADKVLDGCEEYAVIGGKLFDPANELVYEWMPVNYGWDRHGEVVVAREYDRHDKRGGRFICNALQNWREFDPYKKYGKELFDGVTGFDVIEILLPDMVHTDPHADNIRADIEYCEAQIRTRLEDAETCDAQAKRACERAAEHRADAEKMERDAAKYRAALESYLASKEA